MSAERRRYPRSAASLIAHQQVGGRRVRRTVISVSAGGLFIEWQGQPPLPGDLLVLELEQAMPDGLGLLPIKVTAEVVHVERDGVGVRVTRADWDRLGRLVDPPE